jgi:hypothetical protein
MKVTWDWFASNVNVAVRRCVVAGSTGGPLRIVVSAGPTTVKLATAAVGSTFSTGSTARTKSLCCPASGVPRSAVGFSAVAQELYAVAGTSAAVAGIGPPGVSG